MLALIGAIVNFNNISDVLDLYSQDSHVIGALIQDSPWFDRAHNPNLFSSYIDQCTIKTGKKFIYISSIYQQKYDALCSYILKLKEMRKQKLIVKFHPRFSSIYDIEFLLKAVTFSCSHKIPTLFCTYPSYTVNHYTFQLPDLLYIVKKLALISNEYKSPIMLMHSGGTRILEVHDIVRHNQYLWMDLSLTLLKYQHSSVDSDLLYLMNYFDRRIVIGSDFPEGTPSQIYNKWINVFEDLSHVKRRNILHGNVLKFIDGLGYE